MITSAIYNDITREQYTTADHDAVIKALVYFDIFHYPLTGAEIRQFLDRNASETAVQQWIGELQEQGKLFFHNGFYSLQDNPLLSIRRKEGNQYAAVLLKKAVSIGRFLYRFPYVRAIGISGSLSKNFADEKADIDFFIITKSNRLWIARTLMHLYKKLSFLRGRQHFYRQQQFLLLSTAL